MINFFLSQRIKATHKKRMCMSIDRRKEVTQDAGGEPRATSPPPPFSHSRRPKKIDFGRMCCDGSRWRLDTVHTGPEYKRVMASALGVGAKGSDLWELVGCERGTKVARLLFFPPE